MSDCACFKNGSRWAEAGGPGQGVSGGGCGTRNFTCTHVRDFSSAVQGLFQGCTPAKRGMDAIIR